MRIKMIKKIFAISLLLILCMLTCSCAKNLEFKRELGYHYALVENDGYPSKTITVRLDNKGSGYITEMYIDESPRSEASMDIPDVWNKVFEKETDYPITFSDSSALHIAVHFYYGSYKAADAKLLFEYLGIDNIQKNGYILCEDLLNSDSFTYSDVLKNGKCTDLTEFKFW